MESLGTSASSFLLLLPPGPSPPTHDELKATYEETLSQVLKEVAKASEECEEAAILDVALACPHLAETPYSSRHSQYATTQTLVAGLYKLVCVIAAKENINVEDADGVDVRVLLIAWSPNAEDPPLPSRLGPVISLKTLAASQRAWQYAFGVESIEGEAFVRAFVEAKSGLALGNGPSVHSQDRSQASTTSGSQSEERHFNVAVGGTFDHIHLGHKLLLTMTLFAVDVPDADTTREQSIVIGVTGDALLENKKFADQLESWNDRQKSTFKFVRGLLDFDAPGSSQPQIFEVKNPGPNGHAVNVAFSTGLIVKCVEIWDPFGPTITVEKIDALIISAETRSGGKAVNDKRQEKGWSQLEVYEVDVLDPEEGSGSIEGQAKENFQSKLSSTEIRRKLNAKTTSQL